MSREIANRIAAAVAEANAPVRRTSRSKPHRSEPSYHSTVSTPAQRKTCAQGLPPADCNYFHNCLA